MQLASVELMTLMSLTVMWLPASSVIPGTKFVPVKVTSRSPPVPRAPTPGVIFVSVGGGGKTVKPVVAVPPAVVRVTSRAPIAASGAMAKVAVRDSSEFTFTFVISIPPPLAARPGETKCVPVSATSMLVPCTAEEGWIVDNVGAERQCSTDPVPTEA